MYKQYFKIALVAFMTLVFSACQKDDQSFKYDTINDIKIKDAITSFTVVQLDSLIITPNLVESLPTAESFSYSWTLDSKVVSTAKNLRLKILLSPGEYTAVYKVTSNKNGISTLARYTITVEGAYPDGWYVVNNKDGKAKASLIRTDDAVFDNPMETANNKVYTGKAMALHYYNGGLFYFFTDQGVYRFNMNDWLELTNTGGTIPGLAKGLPLKSAPAFASNYLALDQYIVADGGLYVGLAGSVADDVKPFSERIPGDYNLFSGVFPGNLYFTSFYDNKAMKFMQITYQGRVLTATPATPTEVFNMADVGRKMIASDKGVIGFGDQEIEFYYVMENASGVRYLMSTIPNTFGDNTIPGISQQILSSPEINSATNFATSSILKQMYYAVGNRIYLYDILANASRLIYSLPAGYVIKDIEILRSTSKTLVVGANNGAAGEVYYFDIDGLGQFINNTYTKKFTGFGEIVQIAGARQ